MLYAYAARFDVMGNFEKFLVFRVLKTVQDSLSHQILRHMYGTLNIVKNKN